MDPANQVSSIAAWAQQAGKSTGFVTTTSLTHASPSGTYAHVANRFWECDADIVNITAPTDTSECMDIAQQLITQRPGCDFNVIMGGGMSKFLPNTLQDTFGKIGERQDGKNLLATWQTLHPNGVIVTDRDQLLSLDTSQVSDIMGIFNSDIMEYHSLADSTKQPTLAEMTEVALNMLQQNDQGYFIFIEGGNIDTAHHVNKAALALYETLEFEKAIQLARDMTDPQDTLIVVTSDHSHTMTMGGYAGRGSPILGLNQHDRDLNGFKFSTLNYALGPQQYLDETGQRLDLEKLPRNIGNIS